MPHRAGARPLALAYLDQPPCAGQEAVFAAAALNDAKEMMDKAMAALRSTGAADRRRGQTWLGLRSSAEAESVRAALGRARAFADGVTFRCAVSTDPSLGDVYASVLPNQSFVITLSSGFFAAPTAGYSSRAGTIVHEFTHFVLTGATADPQHYGPGPAQSLAASDPSSAQRNAENIEYYSEAVAYGL
jgi:peptidyl-Lys metalloendopeptidase